MHEGPKGSVESTCHDKHYQTVPESNQRLNIAAVSLILAAFLGVVSPLLDMKAMKSPSVICSRGLVCRRVQRSITEIIKCEMKE